MKRVLFLCLISIFILSAFVLVSKKTIKVNYYFNSSKNLQVGEELTYEVSYSFIKLGQIKIVVENKKEENGQTFYSTIGYIDSYSGLPFVNLHQIYESTLNSNYFSVFFRGLVKTKEYTTYTDYLFDYKKSIIHIKKGKIEPPQLWTDSTAPANFEYQDGLSLLYYARIHSGENISIKLPCFVKEESTNTLINFYSPISGVEIDAVKYPIACTHLDGEMKFISIFGLTGYFEGWFSNDDASVPILAKLKVIIGSVRVELKSWKKTGWIPPKYIKS